MSLVESYSDISLFGSHLAVTSYADLSTRVIDFVETGVEVMAVDFANTHVVTLRQHDPEFAALTSCMDIMVPDGMPLVWAMNRKGVGLKDRVYGPTFTREFLSKCPANKTHYLIISSMIFIMFERPFMNQNWIKSFITRKT
jgi:N-acetylglucosaminyldiphosphoundecaprenol N-acetyl-beta-D-mannosaminyltransferase